MYRQGKKKKIRNKPAILLSATTPMDFLPESISIPTLQTQFDIAWCENESTEQRWTVTQHWDAAWWQTYPINMLPLYGLLRDVVILRSLCDASEWGCLEAAAPHGVWQTTAAQNLEEFVTANRLEYDRISIRLESLNQSFLPMKRRYQRCSIWLICT